MKEIIFMIIVGLLLVVFIDIVIGKDHITSSKAISINSFRTSDNPVYKVAKKTGDSILYKTTFTEVPVNVTIDENTSYIRTDTLICDEAPWDTKEIIEYEEPTCTRNESVSVCIDRSDVYCVDQRNVCIEYELDNVTCSNWYRPCAEWGTICNEYGLEDSCVEWSEPIVQSSYNYTVPSEMPFYKGESKIRQTDLTKTKTAQLSPVSPLNPNKFCYQANPEIDFELWLGLNTTFIIQDSDVFSTSLLKNITNETGDNNITHIIIDDEDDVYLEFDGADDYIDMGAVLNIADEGNFTLSAWIKTTHTGDTADSIFVGRADSGGSDSWYIGKRRGNAGADANKMVFWLHDGTSGPGTIVGDMVLTDGVWHHVVGVVDYTSNISTMYVDGKIQSNTGDLTTIVQANMNNNRDFVVGASRTGTSNNFNGSIDEVRMWNRSLSELEINETFDSGRTPNSSLPSDKLVGYWKMEQGVGVSADDSSPEGNDGTLVGDTSWSTWGLGDNLVGYWNFDGDNVNSPGNTSYDFTKFNNDGTMVADAVVNFTDCMPNMGNCAHFDGVADYIDTGTGVGNSLGATNKDLSVALWFNADATNSNDGMINIGDFSSSQGGLSFVMISNEISIRLNSADFQENVAFTDSNSWHHLAATYNGTEVTAYLDSGIIVNSSYSTAINFTGMNTIIGAYFSSSFNFDGSIDEVMVLNRSLTSQQVQGLFENQSGRYFPEGTQRIRAVPITNTSTWQNGGFNRLNLTTGCTNFFNSNCSNRMGLWNGSVDPLGLLLYMPFHLPFPDDASGNGNDGTLVGDTFWNETGGLNSTSSHPNGVFQFDGDGDRIDLGDVTAVEGVDELTISAWVKTRLTEVSNSPKIVDKKGSGTDTFELYWGSPTEDIVFRVSTTSGVEVVTFTDGIDVPGDTNVWKHIVGVYNSSHINIYVDAVEGTPVAQTGTTLDSVHDVSIGAEADDMSGWNGSIDNVQIWNRSLSAEEITILYNSHSNKSDAIYYTDWENGNSGFNNFTISTEADYAFPESRLEAGTNKFSTPIKNSTTIIETWNVSEAVEDTTGPTHSLSDNASSTTTNSTDVQLNDSMTDATGIDFYRIATNNTDGNALTNQSLIDAEGATSLTAIFNESIAWFFKEGGVMGWQVWANDTLGFVSVSAIQTFEVRRTPCFYNGGNFFVNNTCIFEDRTFEIDGNLTIYENGLFNATNVTLTFNSTFQWIRFENVDNSEDKLILNGTSCINC